MDQEIKTRLDNMAKYLKEEFEKLNDRFTDKTLDFEDIHRELKRLNKLLDIKNDV